MDLICIDASKVHPDVMKLFKYWPEQNAMYTYRSHRITASGEIGIMLEEFHNPPIEHASGLGKVEPAYNAKRFTDINDSQLTLAMLKEFEKTMEFVDIDEKDDELLIR